MSELRLKYFGDPNRQIRINKIIRNSIFTDNYLFSFASQIPNDVVLIINNG
jgi:hypothetical protein